MEPFCQLSPVSDNERSFVELVKQNQLTQLRSLLESDQHLVKNLDARWFAFDSPAVVQAKQNPKLVALLVEFGANMNARSSWWAGSFGILDGISKELATIYLQMGAQLDIHSATHLNRIEDVKNLLDADPQLVNAPGGDGQRPLHFARSIEMIDLLIDSGADLEARDLDHSATAVQYLVDKPDLCRHLVAHGASYDVFAATALNETSWLDSLFGTDPSILNHRIGESPTTRPIHPKSDQHIYFWKLKSAKTALEVAENLQKMEALEWVYERSSQVQQWLSCLRRADQEQLAKIEASPADLLDQLDAEQKKSLARAAWAGDLPSVRCFLDAGFDPHLPGDEESTPLDRAAFHGFHQIVSLLLQRDPRPPLLKKNRFGGTPLGACIHGAIHSWRKDTEDSDHLETARLLIEAGAPFDTSWLPTGNEAIDQLLKSHSR